MFRSIVFFLLMTGCGTKARVWLVDVEVSEDIQNGFTQDNRGKVGVAMVLGPENVMWFEGALLDGSEVLEPVMEQEYFEIGRCGMGRNRGPVNFVAWVTPESESEDTGWLLSADDLMSGALATAETMADAPCSRAIPSDTTVLTIDTLVPVEE